MEDESSIAKDWSNDSVFRLNCPHMPLMVEVVPALFKKVGLATFLASTTD
jgi:hypothetical protein